MSKKNKKEILLRGEGIHQHALVGDFMVVRAENDAHAIEVRKESKLVHEKPNGDFGEHNTLVVEAGQFQMGVQVEYNPFTQNVTRVWD